MRASLRAEYQIVDLRAEPLSVLAELTVWLPFGCALWRSVGGPRSISAETHLLRDLEYRLRVLAWQQTEDGSKGRSKPEPPKELPYAGREGVEEAYAQRQAAARRRRLETRG